MKSTRKTTDFCGSHSRTSPTPSSHDAFILKLLQQLDDSASYSQGDGFPTLDSARTDPNSVPSRISPRLFEPLIDPTPFSLEQSGMSLTGSYSQSTFSSPSETNFSTTGQYYSPSSASPSSSLAFDNSFTSPPLAASFEMPSALELEHLYPSTLASADKRIGCGKSFELPLGLTPRALSTNPLLLFLDDFSVAPFDLAFDSNLVAFPFLYDTSSTLSSTSISSVTPQKAAESFDLSLASPLGLTFDSPYSDFLASPLFGETTLDPHSLSYPSLFAPTPSPPLASTSSQPPLPAPVERPQLPRHGASFPPAKPTGFRTTVPPVPLDAPVQPRSYLLPSATSRKRVSVPIQRELAKRQKNEASATPSTPLDTVTEVDGHVELPSDLVAAVERKRAQNTVSARRSRMRKAEKLGELEELNETLKNENEELKRKVEELEQRLRMSGAGSM